ncbi:hypothetical protein EDB83DRAFT_2387809 [Lactarius deliciosus]|nr:hypothetical protein EDB83DRAFT_2387809 [Lactarius deliciosus]
MYDPAFRRAALLTSFTVLRAIGKRARILQSLNFFASQCVLGSTLGMVLFKVPLVVPTRVLWLAMLFVVRMLGLIGQALLTIGLQREAVGCSALAIYSSIVFAIMFEFIFSRTTPSPLLVIGTLIIMSSAMYINNYNYNYITVILPLFLLIVSCSHLHS